MKKVLDIYRIDWQRISKSKAALFLIVALMILPSLYAWFNIHALWDPYGNTSGIKIAVANDDKGTVIKGNTINIGDKIIAQLKNNKSLGWTFVKKNEAEKGVIKGKYYASIYIPEDFSENLSSILSNKTVRPEIIYTVNDKINAITPKITSKGATAIVSNITEEFIGTVSEALLSTFKKLGIELEKELPTIRNMENTLYNLRDAIPKIKAFGDQIITLKEDLPDIESKVNQLLSSEDFIEKIDTAGETILKVHKGLPILQKTGEKITVIYEHLPDIQNAANKVNEFNDHIGSIQNTFDDAIIQVNKINGVIDSVQTLIPSINKLTENSEDYLNVIKKYVNQLDQSFDKVAYTVKLNLRMVNTTAHTITNVLGSENNNALDISQVTGMISQLSGLIDAQINHIQMMIDLGENTPELQQMQANLQNVKSRIQTLQQSINQGSLDKAYQEAVNIQTVTDSILKDYDTKYLPAIRNILKSAQTNVNTAEGVLENLQSQLPNVEDILGGTENLAEKIKTTLENFEAGLPKIVETVQKATITINENVDAVQKAVSTANQFYIQTYPDIETKINKASDFVQNDLPGLKKKLQNATGKIEANMPKLVEAINLAGDLAENKLPGMTSKVSEATEKLNTLKKDVNLEDVIHYLRLDVKSDSEFFASPINLKEYTKYPIANYGSASTPFYTVLAIWVGGILLISMLSVDVNMPKDIYKPYHLYFGRGLTFITIALVQATIVSLGDIFLLKADIHDKWAFMIFSLLLSIIFTTIVYTLVSVFGNIGKGLVIILLVLQISGSGANFPIEVSSSFFQHIYPFLPFTYAVNLMREAVGGVLWSTAYYCIIVLILIGLLFVIFGTLLKKPLMNLVKGFNEDAKKSKIIH